MHHALLNLRGAPISSRFLRIHYVQLISTKCHHDGGHANGRDRELFQVRHEGLMGRYRAVRLKEGKVSVRHDWLSLAHQTVREV